MLNRTAILLLAVLPLFFVFCRKDRVFNTDFSATLDFSLDTLRFDTVFTSLGSSTRLFKVFNPQKEFVRISRIGLAQGESSKFNLNIDGISGDLQEGIEIAPEDSIYVFVEVTINPDEPLSVSPFVVQDSVFFEINGNTQWVNLEAWGQNANYIPSRFGKGGAALLSCDLQEVVWDDPKPYVIYGVLVIDSCTLRLPAGARVYVHGGVARTVDEMGNTLIYNDGLINVFPKGRILSEGTLENPVVIQGDRLETDFAEEPGQWVGIRLSGADNVFDFTTIKNSLIGIYADSSSELTIRNSRIYNTSGQGLIGRRADIDAVNCLLYNNASTPVQLAFGGNYSFDHCTVAAYGVDASALSLSNGQCYDQLCQSFDVFPLEVVFRNCIFSGSRADQIDLIDFSGGMDPNLFEPEFSHCMVRVDELLDPDLGGYPGFLTDFCNPCLNISLNDPLFIDPSEDDYHLDSLSIAIGQAVFLPQVPADLEGNPRDPGAADIGCFERTE